MADRWKNKTWKEKQKAAKIVAIFCAVFLCTSLFKYPQQYEKKDITYKTITLSGKPKFKSITRKNSFNSGHYLELPTKGKIYEVDGADYKYLTNRLEFRSNVKSGTELRIGHIDDEILTLSKDDIQYLQFAKAQFHKIQSSLFAIWLLLPVIVICTISLFFKERPKFKLNDGSYQNVSFGAILFFVCILNFLLLTFIIGYDFIVVQEFIE